MANFLIANRECVFPSVSYAALQLYQPTTKTHYIAWQGGNTPLNILCACAFDLAYQVGAITKQARCMSDDVNARLIYLLEGVSTSWLDTIEWYFRATRTPYLSCVPYDVALRKRLQEVDEIEKECEIAEFMIGGKIRALNEKLKNK